MESNKPTGWVGWVYFAGVMMIVSGIFAGIEGLTALLKNNYYVVAKESLVVFNYTTWGWVHLLLGMVILAAGFAVINGSVWGRVIGVFLAVLSLVANMAFVNAYPVWAIIAMIVDVLVIYALVVHGKEVSLVNSDNV